MNTDESVQSLAKVMIFTFPTPLQDTSPDILQFSTLTRHLPLTHYKTSSPHPLQDIFPSSPITRHIPLLTHYKTYYPPHPLQDIFPSSPITRHIPLLTHYKTYSPPHPLQDIFPSPITRHLPLTHYKTSSLLTHYKTYSPPHPLQDIFPSSPITRHIPLLTHYKTYYPPHPLQDIFPFSPLQDIFPFSHNKTFSTPHMTSPPSGTNKTSSLSPDQLHYIFPFPSSDVADLIHEIEDLRHQNRRLQDENLQLQRQLEAQDEVTASRQNEEEALRRKIKSLQELVEMRQGVMEENEELKTKLLALQETHREQEARLITLERDNTTLHTQASQWEIKQEARLITLERDNTTLHTQASQWEIKWQKTCADLDLAQTELQLKQNEQELMSSNEVLLAEKLKELESLKERCVQLTEKNELLEEEKEEVQLGLSTAALGEGGERVISAPGTKHSPKLRFSTPLHKHSICMELKDRLNEDRHLPSPLCEKVELSHSTRLTGRSALLPTYMSAWEMDVSGSSMQDYSLEMLKSRKSMSPQQADVDVKFGQLQEMERDTLQKEVIRLH
ncbi:KASH5-like protein, partial [Mya arenaria]